MSFGDWIEGLLRDARSMVGGGARMPPPVPLPPAPNGEWYSESWSAAHPEQVLVLELNGMLEWLGDPEHRAEGAGRIAASMRSLPISAVARFDETYRRTLWSWSVAGGPRWLKGGNEADAHHLPQTREPVEALQVPGHAAPWVFGLLAMHPSGYVREGAVRRLAALRGGDELPFLLLRANDWIPAVRAIASTAVEERAALPEYTPHLVHALPLLVRLGESTRGDVDAVVSAVRATLRAPEARAPLVSALGSSDHRVRRPAYALLVADAEGDALLEMVLAGLRSSDLVLRRSAARAAHRLDVDSMRAVLPELMGVRLPGARADAVQIAAKVDPEGERWILAAASDRNALVRATARAALKARGVTDFAAFYRRELETEGVGTEGALLGLGEVGRAEDAEAVEPFLAAASPQVRAAAVEALDHLRRETAVPAILPLLADGAPRVSRAARKALARRPVPSSPLAALFAGEHPPHVRANALTLLARGSRWEAIPWILRGAADGDPRVSDAGRRALGRWHLRFNHSFQAPAPDQLARLAAELDAAGERIDPEMAKWLRDVLRSYGG